MTAPKRLRARPVLDAYPEKSRAPDQTDELEALFAPVEPLRSVHTERFAIHDRADVTTTPVSDVSVQPVHDPAILDEKVAQAEPGEVWALVQRVQAGDAEAFGLIYDAYVGTVFRYVYFRVHDKHIAEDFASETFVRALRRIDSLSFQGRDVGAWLVTIARNIICDHVKSSRYKLEVTSADMRDADRATDGPEDAVLTELTHVELLTCVKQLSPEQQECIVLRFLQGLSVRETAQVMDRNEGAIKALQHRAVRRLARLLPDDLR
ncbi:MAG: sigma-70 family RNA polymerase sigma factor [Geodermatophilaceae bacterium]